jgi:hypothetical protein
VLADGKVVGRILESGSRFDPPGLQWTWSILFTPATPGRTNGTAPTREEAWAKFRAAWEKARTDGKHLETRALGPAHRPLPQSEASPCAAKRRVRYAQPRSRVSADCFGLPAGTA